MMDFLRFLDEDQLAAATADDGVVRVMAGAGTGKTTTLIARLLYLLIERKVEPRHILVVAFTNKAAEEVRNRLRASLSRMQLPASIVDQMRIGTFHSHCSRFLRRAATRVGFPSSFTIADEQDSALLFEEIMQEQRFFENQIGFSPDPDGGDPDKQRRDFQKKNMAVIRALRKDALTIMARWKENGVDRRRMDEEGVDHLSAFERDLVSVLYEYEASLERRHMLDFSDLIGRTCRVLEDFPEIRRSAAGSVHHLLVDEFQDVNRQQKRLVDLLSSVHGNLFVVGDIDQSIYGFRGSIPHIMEEMSVQLDVDVTLRNNRRCTREILAVANGIVEMNRPGIPKQLESDRDGRRVEFFAADNEYAEAAIIAQKVETLLQRRVPANQIAVLLRTSHLAKAIETSFLKKRIPYTLVSGLSFVEREEIKDMVSYLRLLLNPHDDLSFLRIINKPLRGLGPTAAQGLRSFALAHSMSLLEACDQIAAGGSGVRLTKRGLENLADFVSLMEVAKNYAQEGELGLALKTLVVESGYQEWLKSRDSKDVYRKRHEHLKLLMGMAEGNSELYDLLDRLSLASDVEEQGRPNAVVISTIHAAKGMEFDHVFCPALEQGVLPHTLSLDEPGDEVDLDDIWSIASGGGVREERRLAHVAFTRPRHHLVISCAKRRNNRRATPSDFVISVGLCAGQAQAPSEMEDDHQADQPRLLSRIRRQQEAPVTDGPAIS